MCAVNHRSSNPFLIKTRRTYKIYAHIGANKLTRCKHSTTLDTGAGWNLIRCNEHSTDAHLQIHVRPLPNLHDAKSQPRRTTSWINLTLRLANAGLEVKLIVYLLLAAQAMRSAYFCDRQVKASRPKPKLVEQNDGKIVPIVPYPRKCATSQP